MSFYVHSLGGVVSLSFNVTFSCCRRRVQSNYFLFFFFCRVIFFFDLKFSWGRLEKETQIPEDRCTRGLGLLTLSPGQRESRKPGRAGAAGPCGDAVGFRLGLTLGEVLFCPLASPAVLWKVTPTGDDITQGPLCPQHHLCATAQCRDPFLPTENSG